MSEFSPESGESGESGKPVERVAGLARARQLAHRMPLVWFHIIGAGILTLPYIVLGGENSVCTTWTAMNLPGVTGLSCAAKLYVALFVALSALWLTIYAIPSEARDVTTGDNPKAQSQALAGLSARFAVFFAVSIIGLETLARTSEWIGPLTG